MCTVLSSIYASTIECSIDESITPKRYIFKKQSELHKLCGLRQCWVFPWSYNPHLTTLSKPFRGKKIANISLHPSVGRQDIKNELVAQINKNAKVPVDVTPPPPPPWRRPTVKMDLSSQYGIMPSPSPRR